ncbi:dipeptidase [bacterium]|nr:dipeptidase [bacterium]
MKTVQDYIQQNKQQFLHDLTQFLRIPSISAHSGHKADCRIAAHYLVQLFDRMGLRVTVHETEGNPVLVATYVSHEQHPTVLIYGHYDVQPVDPVDLWTSPPFEPQIEGDTIYARGATDNKGQLLAHIEAVEALLKVKGWLKVNITFLIEGEEETASDTLERFIREHKDELRCDVVVVSDSSQFAENKPAICYGLRGICTEEIRVEGPNSDLHSGIFGGAVPNPAEETARIISRLKDEKGKITIPGFYDDVLPLPEWEREAFANLPFDGEEFKAALNIPATHGEEGYSIIEQRWARPTLEVNGIFGGYMEEGSKTVLPAWAGAKFSMRLVPNQDPQKIHDVFVDYVKQVAPAHVKVSFKESVGAKAVLIPRDAAFMQEAIEAIKQGFGKKPVFIREGGSIPIVITFQEELGANTLLIGLGQPDDNAHAPNEKFSLRDFERGILTSACFLVLAGETKS